MTADVDVTMIDRFRPDSIIARSVSILVRNIVHFGGAAVLVFMTPVVLLTFDVATVAEHLGRLVTFAFGSVVAGVIETTVLSTILALLTFMPVGPLGEDTAGLAIALVWVLAQILYAAVVMAGSWAELCGDDVNIADMTLGGLRVVIPVFFVAMVVGTPAGLVAISPNAVFGAPDLTWQILRPIVAMVVIGLFWVAVPLAAIEGLGAIDSLKRSWRLARGSRLRILGLLLVLYAIGLVLGGLVMVTDQAWLGACLMVVLTAVNASVLTVAYHDLRLIREVPGSDEIARVFD